MSDNERPPRTNVEDHNYADWMKDIEPEDEDPEVIVENVEDRDYADWMKDIGPEDEDPEVIVENIEEAFSLFSEDDYESNPTTPSDMPDWTEEAAEGEEMTFFPSSNERMSYRLDSVDGFEIIDEDEL